MVFVVRMAPTGCRKAPPARRTRWVFYWGYSSLSRRPRRAVVACCRANSSFRVPLGTTGAFAGFASQNAARNPARHALEGKYPVSTMSLSGMISQGARTETVGRSRVAAEVVFEGLGAWELGCKQEICTPQECASRRHPGRGELLGRARSSFRWRWPARGLG